MLQSTLGVVWLGPLRHECVIAGSSVVNAAPATFADADGNKNSRVAATAANVVRPASGRRPGLRFIWCLLPRTLIALWTCRSSLLLRGAAAPSAAAPRAQPPWELP